MELYGTSKPYVKTLMHGVPSSQTKRKYPMANQTTYWRRAGASDSESVDKRALIYSKIEELRAASSPSSPTCFRCTDIGHCAYQCQNPISCFACNRLGHKAFQCRAITEMKHDLKAAPLKTLPLIAPSSLIVSEPINEKSTRFHLTSSQDETLRMNFVLNDDEQQGILRVQKALCQLIPHHDWVVKISKNDIHIEMKIGGNCVRQTHFSKPLQGETKDEGSSTCIHGDIRDKIMNETHIGSNAGDVLQTNETDTQIEMEVPSVSTYEAEYETELEKRETIKSEGIINKSTDATEITSAEQVFIERRISDTKIDIFEKGVVEIEKDKEIISAQRINQQETLKSATHHLRLSGGSRRARRNLTAQIAYLKSIKKVRNNTKGRTKEKNKKTHEV